MAANASGSESKSSFRLISYHDYARGLFFYYSCNNLRLAKQTEGLAFLLIVVYKRILGSIVTCVISVSGIFLLLFMQDSRKRTLPMTVKPSVIGGMGGRNTETINDRKQLSACIRRRGIDAMFCGELPHFFSAALFTR